MVPLDFGIKNQTQKNFTCVYPNPSDGNVNILIPETGTGSFTFTVFDMTGRLLQTGTLDGAGDRISFPLDLTHLSKGIYLLKLDGGKSIYENKVIIH
jgi:hypothetical protein